MCSCPSNRSSNSRFMRTEPRIIYEWSCTASARNHAHLIWQLSTIHGEVSWPPLLWIGKPAWIRLESIVPAATIQIMKIAWVTYLGTVLRLNAILILKYRPIPQPWPNIKCTAHAHGPSFARVWYKFLLFHHRNIEWNTYKSMTKLLCSHQRPWRFAGC